MKKASCLKLGQSAQVISGMVAFINNVLGDVLEPIAEYIKGIIKVNSSEQMLYKIDCLNKE